MAPRKSAQFVYNVKVYGDAEPCGERPRVLVTVVAPDVGSAAIAGEEAFSGMFPKLEATNIAVELYEGKRPVISA